MNPHSLHMVTSDNFAIWLGLASAICACAGYLVVGLRRNLQDCPLARFARGCFYVCVASIAAACLYLLQSILSGSRFDIAYIYENSGPRDGLLYQVSSLWAGQGGSLLLWALIGGLIGLCLLKRLERSSPMLISFWSSIQCFFLIVMVVDDPLKKLAVFQPGMVGGGMNPLLKNPWMAIHPPVVFLGYALLIVPAAFALQALIDGDASRWAKRCLPWALAGWIAMTIGLVLGMVWSYEVLGWGGYWGWDPVENASLVPWLISTALVHGLVLQRTRGTMALWNVILAFATFLSVMYATFLTRSGILSSVSVHSFGKTPAFNWLMAFPIAYAALCVGLLIAKWRSFASESKPIRAESREFALAVGLIVLSLFAIVVLVGTTYTTFDHKSCLDGKFYTHMSIPLSIAMLVLLALSPAMGWGGEMSSNLRGWLRALAVVAGIAIVGGLISLASPAVGHRIFGCILSEGGLGSRVAAGGVLLILGASVVALLSNLRHMTGSTLRRCGSYVSHAGLALLVIGVVMSTAGRTKVIDLAKGGPSREAFGYRFSYLDRTMDRDDASTLRIVAVRNGRKTAMPLRVVAHGERPLMFPHIASGPIRDIYVAPDNMMSTVVTPMLAMTQKGWVSQPMAIPGSNAVLALEGMQVESHLATLDYVKQGVPPVRFELSKGHSKTIDGYTFTFEDFDGSGEMNSMKMTAGVKVDVQGRGLTDSAAIRVSTKPLISLLWLGTLLVIAGGTIAFFRRRAEKAE